MLGKYVQTMKANNRIHLTANHGRYWKLVAPFSVHHLSNLIATQFAAGDTGRYTKMINR